MEYIHKKSTKHF